MKGSFLWPYIIPANIPLGIQYYHLSALLKTKASCREHNEVFFKHPSKAISIVDCRLAGAAKLSHANTARSILGMAKYGQINVRANLRTPSL